jgi:hypothetical protein
MPATFVCFPPDAFQAMNASENARWLALVHHVADDKVGLVMIFDLKKRTDLNMQFGIVQKSVTGGRVVVQVCDTGEVVKVKEDNVTQHHKVILKNVLVERFIGQEATALSLLSVTKRLGQWEKGKTRESFQETQYEICLDQTKKIHHVLRDQFDIVHQQRKLYLIPTLAGLRQYYQPGDDVVLFETDKLKLQRQAKEALGNPRSTMVAVLWPGGPELDVAQVLALYGSVDSVAEASPLVTMRVVQCST